MRSLSRTQLASCVALGLPLGVLLACNEGHEVLGTKPATDAGPDVAMPSGFTVGRCDSGCRDGGGSGPGRRDAGRKGAPAVTQSAPSGEAGALDTSAIEPRPTNARDAATPNTGDPASSSDGATPTSSEGPTHEQEPHDVDDPTETDAALQNDPPTTKPVQDGAAHAPDDDATWDATQPDGAAPANDPASPLRYPTGCNVTTELPDPGWCTWLVECPDVVLATDCRTDSLSWDCITDSYFSESSWSAGSPDEYRLLRVPTELTPRDACTVATQLAANRYTPPPGTAAECGAETGKTESGNCTRSEGCWYTLPDSTVRFWEDTSEEVYCSYRDAELWDEVEQDHWQCYYRAPGGERSLVYVDDGDEDDACESTSDLFTGFAQTLAPSCELTSFSARQDDCSAAYECTANGVAGTEPVTLRFAPNFDCVRGSGEPMTDGSPSAGTVSCTCGTGSVVLEVGTELAVDGWCETVSAACASGLEDGTITF
jgi:hypothetical protein